MLNWTLYKRGLLSNWKILLIFGAVLTMYFTIIISMYDPALGSALLEFAKAMPEMMSMVGMNPTSTTLVGHISAYLYGFIMLVFPMVFSILCANRLLAKHVDKGSMSYLLAAPVNRRTVAFTQMKVLGTGIFALVCYATVLSIIVCHASFPGKLDISKFLLINLGVFCLQLFIGGICFFCSCLFNDSKYSVGFGAGIPAICFILQMAANAGEKYADLKYTTFFTLFNPDNLIAAKANALWGIAALFVGAVVLYCAAMLLFSKKDLHI